MSQAEGSRLLPYLGIMSNVVSLRLWTNGHAPEMALRNGADLVIWCHFWWLFSQRITYCKSAVDILDRFGVDKLAFGTEENLDYQHFSQIYARIINRKWWITCKFAR